MTVPLNNVNSQAIYSIFTGKYRYIEKWLVKQKNDR